MARRSLAALVAACVTVSCAGARESPAGPPPPRQPDGVFLDVPTAEPSARSQWSLGPSGPHIIALARPVSREEVLTLVRAYFRAFGGHDASAFAPLLLQGAKRVEEGASAELASSLERRERAVDYSRVRASSLARFDALKLLAYADAPEDVRAPLDMRDGDVLVRVPMNATDVRGVRVFGPEVRLLLRRVDRDGPWLIAALDEPGGP